MRNGKRPKYCYFGLCFSFRNLLVDSEESSPEDSPGADSVDNRVSASGSDAINGNVSTANIVSESTNSMDVLSGGESEAGDTLNRRNNNSILSTAGTLRESSDVWKRGAGDLTYFVTKELLMTERTYKRDLELVTVTWSTAVSALTSAGSDVVLALARPCLALEPLALPAGAFLARLDRCLAADHSTSENDEPEYKKIADLLYDYLSCTAEAYAEYTERAGALVAMVESVRRRCALADSAARELDQKAPLPLACLLLRPLHRAHHTYTLAAELAEATEKPSLSALKALELSRALSRLASDQLRHAENHAALCQLQRDIVGYDKLLVADREFLRLGCVYKHTSRGLQQRMFFLFSDVLVVAAKAGATQFRAHAAYALHTLHIKPADLPHSFTITGGEETMIVSTSNDAEYEGWLRCLEEAIERASECPTDVDTELTPYEQETGLSSQGPAPASNSGGALAHVCWHRAASLTRGQLHLAMGSQLSGYLLRKFKNSHGWQKLWVVFAMFTLFFYKSWQDDSPLASLPLLGYSVGPPSPSDEIHKDFVFKLQFKNHVYFFRADSQYTYSRWTEVLHTAMLQSYHSSHPNDILSNDQIPEITG